MGAKTELAYDNKAIIGLKSLLREKRDDLDRGLVAFINTLLTDIRKYKTLPKYTLRKLRLPEKKNPYDELMGNIKDLRRRIGDDYLRIILSRTGNVENDVIIAVGNYKG